MNETDKQTALVLGASGGLGEAFIGALAKRSDFGAVLGVSRSARPAASSATCWFEEDATRAENLAGLADRIAAVHPRIHLLVNCIGVLHDQDQHANFSPEKALRQLRLENLQRAMEINAFAPLAALQAFAPLMRTTAPDHEPSLAMVLSAMVGSITDNQLGGWYSYRMSKAALNMGLRNVAIEFSRLKGAPTIVAMHPGTTLTRLSEPFVKRHKYRTPAESADCMLNVAAGLGLSDTGKFFNWDGRELPF